MNGTEYLKKIIGPQVRKVLESKHDFELDSARLNSSADIVNNVKTVFEAAGYFLEAIIGSEKFLPK